MTDNINSLSFQNIKPILKEEEGYQYICPKCHQFPLIEFTESIKTIKLGCKCYNNKEILIKDLFDKYNKFIIINQLSNLNLLSSSNIFEVNNGDEVLTCKKHNNYFRYYCKKCHLDLCDMCAEDDERKHGFILPYYIELESMKIDNEKLDKIIAIINSKNINNLNINENNIKLLQIDYTHFEKKNEEEEDRFIQFIRIIIKDFKNFSNYFNALKVINFFYLDYNKINITNF